MCEISGSAGGGHDLTAVWYTAAYSLDELHDITVVRKATIVTLIMEAVGTSETSVCFSLITVLYPKRQLYLGTYYLNGFSPRYSLKIHTNVIVTSTAGFLKLWYAYRQWYASHCSVVHGHNKKK
jgi:hypothetical protein